jgi:hypothetical protein
MSEAGDAKHSSRAGQWTVWSLAAVLVLYVLSIGPVNAVVARHWMFKEEPTRTLRMCYAPLRCLKGCRPAAMMIYRYEDWCDQHWPGTRPPFETWLFHSPDAIEIPAGSSFP